MTNNFYHTHTQTQIYLNNNNFYLFYGLILKTKNSI